MRAILPLPSIALAMALVANAAPGWAQTAAGQASQSATTQAHTEVVAFPNPDADALSQQMRVLAADPHNVSALLEAGRMSARLGDMSAALAFFQRAETIEPSNPRILAGRGAALVRLERPGEALTLFQAAEARGVPAREYAADRGFAYDLLGQPALAQKDYRVALQQDRDDETTRRFALSLGISGNVEEAMAALDPLLRRSDRAGWRARAFILAMNDDVPGAEKIAASMLGNLGPSLVPFFRRLTTLAPADRAFAVHFGELSPTQARLADARLAPALPRYVPDARPVQVAQAQPARPATASSDRRSRRDRGRTLPTVTRAQPQPVQTAAVTPPPRPTAPAAQPLPAAPTPQPAKPSPALALVQPTPASARPSSAPVQVATRDAHVPERTVMPAAASLPVRPAPVAQSALAPAQTAPAVAQPALTRGETATARAGDAPLPPEASAIRRLGDTSIASEPRAEAAQPVAIVSDPRPEPAPPGPAKAGQEDSVLASIVAGITIPADELEAVNNPVTAPEPVRIVEAPRPAVSKPAARLPTKPVVAEMPEKLDPKAKPDAKAKPDPKAKAELAKVDSKGKKLDPKKTEPKKLDPKKEAAKADPARIWVQVAGGANEASLPKAWKAIVAKAPAAFKGRSGWSTPLRATNRVLAGPFKSAAEAQSFVNALTKAGLSGFVFTSEAGQKVTKLAN